MKIKDCYVGQVVGITVNGDTYIGEVVGGYNDLAESLKQEY